MVIGLGLSCTLLRSSLNVSFFCLSAPSSHLSLFVTLPHVSYFLTISAYLHHHILCHLLCFHLVCRLSSVPLERGLAFSIGRSYSIQCVDYHPSLRRCVFLWPLAVGFCMPSKNVPILP